MKYLLLLLFLTGCGKATFLSFPGHRFFAVGDCLIQSDSKPEKWEISEPEYRVLELGHNAYLVQKLGSFPYKTIIEYGHLFEDFYQQVPCKENK